MKAVAKIIFYIAPGIIFSWASPVVADDFKILVHNITPGHLISGKDTLSAPKGMRLYALEIAKEILRSTEHEFSVHDVPLQRGLYEISKNNNIFLLPLRKTEDRFSKANWIGPIYKERDFLFSRAGRVKNKVISTALPTSACTIRGAAFEANLAAHGIENIVKANSYLICIDMLIIGRVDYVAMPESEIYYIYPEGENSEIVKYKMIGEGNLYIAVSKDISSTCISAFKMTLSAMKEDGRMAKLQDKLIHKKLLNLMQ